MENFTIIEEITQTQFSTITLCRNETSKNYVVLKSCLQKKIDEAPDKETLRELAILMNVVHPNIIKCFSIFVHKTNIVFELEYCVLSLNDYINNTKRSLSLSLKKKIIKSIAEGLSYLHKHDIIHRDIKPSNILIDNAGNIKICDFGSCRILGHNTISITPQVGTKWYKAPEIIFGSKEYKSYVDIWSFGCLIAELFLRKPLFPGQTDFEMINYMIDMLGFTKDDFEVLKPQIDINFVEYDNLNKLFVDIDENISDLLRKMIVMDFTKRIKIDDVVYHEGLKILEEYSDVRFDL